MIRSYDFSRGFRLGASSAFRAFVVALGLFLSACACQAQGFINLNFEAATNLGTPGDFSEIPATNAFPGWTVSALYIVYDDISLSGNSVSIYDTNGYLPSIQGKYFAVLEGGNYSDGNGHVADPVSLGQTGQIPSWAQSITFWGNEEGLQVTFNNQPLNITAIGAGSDYTIYGADISEFAGQTGYLLFTQPAYTGGTMLDNIGFSTSPVPEPNTFFLSILSVLFALGSRHFKTKL